MSEENTEWTVDRIHSSLSNTSVELHYVFWNVPREEQVKRPSPDKWSPLETLIHLRQVGEVYAERVKRVVDRSKDESEDELPYLHDFDEEKQMSRIELDEETVKYNLGSFMQARSELLNKISFLDEEEWDTIKCRHEKTGLISLRELLIPLVRREEKHLKRIKDMLSV